MSTKHFYSPNQILVGSILGGLPAGLYLYRLNTKIMEKEKEGNQLFILGIVATVIVCSIPVFTHARRWLDSLVKGAGIACAITPWILAKQTQGQAFQQHIASGGPKGSYAAAIGIGLISLLATVSLIMLEAGVFGQ